MWSICMTEPGSLTSRPSSPCWRSRLGKNDLQQCADAVMRLRAEYLLDAGRDNEICFIDNAGRKYLYNATGSSLGFERYLERVYSYCGTASLSRQLKKVNDFEQIKPGDILIK